MPRYAVSFAVVFIGQLQLPQAYDQVAFIQGPVSHTIQAAAKHTTRLSSDNGLYHECDFLTVDQPDYCVFAPTAAAPWTVSIKHNIDRTVGADGERKVFTVNGAIETITPVPWTNGDYLGDSGVMLTGDSLLYVLAFELVAPLRDEMMYEPKFITNSRWAELTKAFNDCGVKSTTVGGVLSVADVYSQLKAPGGVDIHHFVLQFLEEGAIDLVCMMTSATTLPTFERCIDIRAQNSAISNGCWGPAYRALYPGSDLLVDGAGGDAATTTTTAVPVATTTVVPVATTTAVSPISIPGMLSVLTACLASVLR